MHCNRPQIATVMKKYPHTGHFYSRETVLWIPRWFQLCTARKLRVSLTRCCTYNLVPSALVLGNLWWSKLQLHSFMTAWKCKFWVALKKRVMLQKGNFTKAWRSLLSEMRCGNFVENGNVHEENSANPKSHWHEMSHIFSTTRKFRVSTAKELCSYFPSFYISVKIQTKHQMR